MRSLSEPRKHRDVLHFLAGIFKTYPGRPDNSDPGRDRCCAAGYGPQTCQYDSFGVHGSLCEARTRKVCILAGRCNRYVGAHYGFAANLLVLRELIAAESDLRSLLRQSPAFFNKYCKPGVLSSISKDHVKGSSKHWPRWAFLKASVMS